MIRATSRGCQESQPLRPSLWKQRDQLHLRTVSTNSAINRILRKAQKGAKAAHDSRFKRNSTPITASARDLGRGVVPGPIPQSIASQERQPMGVGRTKSAALSRTKRSEPVRGRGKAFADKALHTTERGGRYDSSKIQERRYGGKGSGPLHDTITRGAWRRRNEEGGDSTKPSPRAQISSFSGSSMVELEPAAQKPNHLSALSSEAEARHSRGRGGWHEKKDGSHIMGTAPNRKASKMMRDFRDGPTSRGPGERPSTERSPTYVTPGKRDDRRGQESRIPVSLPYTTSASEFLYGLSTTVAALKACQRRLYKLYLHPRAKAADGDYMSLKTLASAADVQVKEVDNDWLPIMDKMSEGRPHNGCILEASPLPRLPVNSLRKVPARSSTFDLDLAPQSREDIAVNGEDTQIKYDGKGWRYPFLLMLDGIQDPGNLGAIVRSAYFLGVDAIAMSTRSSAPLSPVAIKASAGAAEATRFFGLDDPRGFAEKSVRNGWRFYAAVAPSDKLTSGRSKPIASTELISPLADTPCVLMLGGEGEGLSRQLQQVASHRTAIAGARSKNEVGVDSLNVSVAAALLCDAFLRKPSMGRQEEPAEMDKERLF